VEVEPSTVGSRALAINVGNVARVVAALVLVAELDGALALAVGAVDDDVPALGVGGAVGQPEEVVSVLADFAGDIGGAVVPIQRTYISIRFM
jgi:hypothetical protein